MMTDQIDVTEIRTVPMVTMSGFAVTMRSALAPKKNWYVYCSAIDRPIVTIICCVVPDAPPAQRVPDAGVLDPAAERRPR